MKKLTKLLSLALAILMVMSLAATAFAEAPIADAGTTPPQTTIKLTGAVPGSKFAFYKLCDALKDGSNFTYQVNSAYSTALLDVLKVDSDAAAIAKLRDMTDPSTIRAFADAIYAKISSGSNDGEATADGSGLATFPNDSGYYLIAQISGGSGTTTAYSLVMLDTGVGDEKTVPVKVDTPKSFKKVIEKNDTRSFTSSPQDGADYDVGDPIEFLLRGQITKNLNSYTKPYKVLFHDKACDGLDFQNVKEVRVSHKNGTVQVVHPDSYTVTETPGDTNQCDFHVELADARNLYQKKRDGSKGDLIEMHGDEELQVSVIMTLTESATIGSEGNPNVSSMEYSNNPYDENSTGKTPDDLVKVYTHKLKVIKQDDSGNALTGASFQLSKVILKDPNVTYGKPEDVYTTTPWGSVNTGTDSDKSIFEWNRLDAGTYVLEEVAAPAGYSKADKIYFTITATYEENYDDTEAKTYTLSVKNRNADLTENTDRTFDKNDTTGEISTTIVNIPGTALPSTGGVGTTLFYVFGSILAIGAGVLLVSKKRMGAAE